MSDATRPVAALPSLGASVAREAAAPMSANTERRCPRCGAPNSPRAERCAACDAALPPLEREGTSAAQPRAAEEALDQGQQPHERRGLGRFFKSN